MFDQSGLGEGQLKCDDRPEAEAQNLRPGLPLIPEDAGRVDRMLGDRGLAQLSDRLGGTPSVSVVGDDPPRGREVVEDRREPLRTGPGRVDQEDGRAVACRG
jgi:hypothetical protein